MRWNRWAGWARLGRAARRGGKPAPERRQRAAGGAPGGRRPPALPLRKSIADNITRGDNLTLPEAVLLVNAGGNQPVALGRNLTPNEGVQVTGTFGAGDTIQFDPSIAGRTITLGTGVPGGSLVLTKPVDIQGPNGGITVASNGGSFSIFTVQRTGTGPTG